LQIVLRKEPDNPGALILQSEALAAKGDAKSIIIVLNKLKKLLPDSPEGWFRMGRLYKAQKKFKKAHNEFKIAWSKSPKSVELLAELIDFEISLKEFETSEKRLNKLLDDQPDHPVAHKFLGMVYSASKKLNKAEKEFIAHLEKKPNDYNAILQMASLNNLKKDLKKSEYYYLQGLKYYPNDFKILFGLASIYEIKKDFDKAIQYYVAILESQPDNALATNNLAMLLVNNRTSAKDKELATKLAEKFIGNKQPVFQDTLGWVYYKNEKYEQAVNILETAVKAAPKIPIFHYHLGMAYFKTGKNNLAKKHLQKAIKEGRFNGLKEAKETLNSL